MEKLGIFDKFLILEQKSEEESLVYLYESLIYCDIIDCEIFIDSIIEDYLSSDAIVHTLNALSIRKKEIYNWEKFLEKSTKRLIDLEGEKTTKTLLEVIN